MNGLDWLALLDDEEMESLNNLMSDIEQAEIEAKRN